MPWLAVARALVPGVFATVVAVIASHTLTTTSSSGSLCRRRSSRALLMTLSSVLIPDPYSSPRRPARSPR